MNGDVTKILVIEDDPGLQGFLDRLLSQEGYAVSLAGDAASGLQQAVAGQHDLVLLDLALPDLGGEVVLRAVLGAHPGKRVIVLSATTDRAVRAEVLDAGAVDFVGKPFVNSDLLARIRLRSRRRAPAEPRPLPEPEPGTGFELDPDSRELVLRGQRTPLSPREYMLLAHLARKRDRACTRQELLTHVWGLTFDPGTNVVDVYIRRLRAKLDPDTIETVRNVGYRLTGG